MDMPVKRKILWIADHPLVPSGVGTQSKNIIEGMLATGKYRFVCLGGAVQHPDYRPQKVMPEKYGDDWLILPVNGYGDKNLLRQMLHAEKPDAIVIFTDPRFFTWVWEMEDEIKAVCPLLYWHVWDDDPPPHQNMVFYESTDHVAALSLKTYGLLQALGYKRCSYVPHALPPEMFRPLPEDAVQQFKQERLGPHKDKKFVVMWNNRNARRKMTGDVVASFSKFADKVGRQNVALLMHTQPNDPEGQDLIALAKFFKVESELIISENRLPPDDINMFYNVADCVMSISSNEGFGLGTLESLQAGTPIVVHMTGGLQFQIGDWWEGLKDFSDQDKMTSIAKLRWKQRFGKWFGVPVFSASRSCTGSQQIPYIYDDRVHHDDVVKALEHMYKMTREQRKSLGVQAREWVLKNFNLGSVLSQWDEMFTREIDRHKNNPPSPIRTAVF